MEELVEGCEELEGTTQRSRSAVASSAGEHSWARARAAAPRPAGGTTPRGGSDGERQQWR